MTRVTSTDYARPYRPAAVRALNAVGRAMGRVAPRLGGRLDVDGLVAAARKSTGLTDFADEGFREPLGRLVEDIEAHAALSTMGRIITRYRLVDVLSARLRVDTALAAEPSILEAPIRRPIIITGLQRTGTTMLHRLLAADPAARAIASWEAMQPAPLDGGSVGGGAADGRIAMARRGEKALRFLAPDFFAVHPVEALAPEEEVVILDQTFLSTVAEASWRVPEFAAWLERQDQTPAYRHLRRAMQLLQRQRGGDPWVLKTPHHLEWLDVLVQVFPDALIVQTHRDPRTTVASFCSMVAHGRGIFSDVVDPHEVGRHWMRKIERMVTRAMAARDGMPDGGPVLDVFYRDLMADPIGEVRRIYAAAGRELGPAGAAAMEASRAVNRKDRHGRHRYSLDDFGLTEDEVAARMAAYCARYDVPLEP